jgi:hypothetical protein
MLSVTPENTHLLAVRVSRQLTSPLHKVCKVLTEKIHT